MLCITHTKIMVLVLAVIENVKITGPGVFTEMSGVSIGMIGVFTANQRKRTLTFFIGLHRTSLSALKGRDWWDKVA